MFSPFVEALQALPLPVELEFHHSISNIDNPNEILNLKAKETFYSLNNSKNLLKLSNIFWNQYLNNSSNLLLYGKWSRGYQLKNHKLLDRFHDILREIDEFFQKVMDEL